MISFQGVFELTDNRFRWVARISGAPEVDVKPTAEKYGSQAPPETLLASSTHTFQLPFKPVLSRAPWNVSEFLVW